MSAEVLAVLLDQLAGAGYLQRRDGRDGHPAEWNTTLTGGALTMASFLKPISRARAEKLLAEVLERAVEYNADDTKLYVTTEIAVFGSYLHSGATEHGDLDLSVKFTGRRPDANEPGTLFAYADASGRNFPTLLATLAWPQTELLQLLRINKEHVRPPLSRPGGDDDEIFRSSRGQQGPLLGDRCRLGDDPGGGDAEQRRGLGGVGKMVDRARTA